MKDVFLSRVPGAADLSVLFVGSEQCKREHRFGPHVRQHYLIHFCLSGCGTLWDKNGTHRIGAGEMFVIRPGEVTVYQADAKDPWSYCWVAFLGNAAGELDSAPSVFKTPQDIDTQTAAYIRSGERSETIYLSLLFKLFYHLFH